MTVVVPARVWALVLLLAALPACDQARRAAPALGRAGVLSAAFSRLAVDRPSGVLANGTDRAVVTVAVRDELNQPMPGLFVELAASGPNAVIYQPLSGTDAQGEVDTRVASRAAGKVTFSATVLQGSTRIALSSTVQVDFSPAPARLVFTIQPSHVTAGQSMAPAVQVGLADAAGNVVTTATGVVSLDLTQNLSGAQLAGPRTAPAVNGIATFSGLSVQKAGTAYTLGATATGLASATSAAFDVSPGPAAALAFKAQPTGATTGAAMSPAIEVLVTDAYGNPVTASVAAVTVSLGNLGAVPTGAVLSGTTTVNAANGVATFSGLAVNQAGAGYLLAAASPGLTGATSSAFDVAAVTATQLVFQVQPAGGVIGVPWVPAVQVALADASGRRVTTATHLVTVALGANPSGATLSSTLTVQAVAGVAEFTDLKLDKAGVGYTLVASAAGLTPATSQAFTVTVLSPSRVSFSVQPAGGASGSPMSSLQVTIQGLVNGQLVTAPNSSLPVTVSLGNNTAGATLSGTTTVNAQNSVATFSNLTVSKAGTGYTLTATAQGLISATSAAFNVTGPAAPLQSVAPAWGPLNGNTKLAITGSGFTAASTAWVGGKQAGGVVVASGTQLECLTPAGVATGAVDVEVRTGAQSSKLVGGFRYLAWQPLGPQGGSADFLAFRPGSTTVAYAATKAGLYKSTDSGATWTRKTAGLSTAAVSTLAFVPGTPDVMYAGTRVGLARSMDAGETWSQLGKPMATQGGGPLSVEAIAIDPNDPQKMLVAGVVYGVYRSTDGGATWTDVSGTGSGLPSGPMPSSLAFDPTNGQRAYLGNQGGKTEGFWISTDGGQTWVAPTVPPTGQSRTILLDPANPATIYFTTNAGIFKSTDRGDTWAAADQGIQPTSSGGKLATAILADPAQSSKLYVASSTNVYVSNDSAGTWSALAAGLPGRAVNSLVLGGSRLLAGVDYVGVFRSDNGGAWAASSTGLFAVPVRGLSVVAARSQRLAVCSNANPFVWVSDNAGAAWTKPTAGFTSSSSVIALDPRQPDVIYAGTTGQGVWKSVDGGRNFAVTGYKTGNVEVLTIDGSLSPSVVWAATYGQRAVSQSDDGGATWTQLASAGLTSSDLRVIALVPNRPWEAWLGCGPVFNPGIFFWDSTAWSDKGAGLGTPTAKSVEGITPVDSNKVYLATWEGAFRTTDGGATWNALGSSGLSFAYHVLPDPNTATMLWAAATGISWSRDDGATWEDFSAGVEKLTVRRLVADPANPKRIYAATGGGVYVLEQP